MQDSHAYTRRRKWFTAISVAVVAMLALLVTLLVWRWLAAFSQEGFRDYIRSFGAAGWLVLLGLQFLQVFIALIPGELLESAAGFVFGPVLGTVICYIGVALASVCIILLTRRFGVKLVEVFVPREKIAGMQWLKQPAKRNTLVFLAFFIPGTPKDFITYFIGLTDMKLGNFLLLSLVARIPSVITSTVGGHLLGLERYGGAIWVYGITGALSLAGFLVYRLWQRRRTA
jgi:uncharacterized membrane protein YdjX (TVP38/TMEM64 family)